jgi:hypothetical protein
MKSQGANITEFEKSAEQVAYEQAVAQWQQVAMAYADKGVPFNQPQPLPEQFGYSPNGKQPNKDNEQQPSILEQFMAASTPSEG